MISRILAPIAAWLAKRRARRQAAESVPVPDFLEMHLEDARNAVKLEKEKQKLIVEKTKTAKMEAEAADDEAR